MIESLEVETLLVVYQMLGAMVLAFIVAGAWHARSLGALWMWAAGFAAVWFSQMARIPVTETWGVRASLPVGHVGALLHAALLVTGIRSFVRMPPRSGLVAFVVAAGATTSLATVYALGMRPGWSLGATQIASGLLLAVGGWDALRAYRRGRHSTLLIMSVVLALSALVAGARGLNMVVALLPAGRASGAALQSANAPWLLATIALLVAQGFAILLLVNGALQREVQALADLDPLTGLLNRRGLGTRMERMLSRTAGGEPPALAVAVIDLDHFKAINDRLGHHGGDRVLVRTARRLRSVVRPHDLVARVGGEEFVLILDDVRPGTLPALAERVRRAVAVPVETEAGATPVTVSMGVATPRPGETMAETMKRADQALYRAKREGRDRVVLAG